MLGRNFLKESVGATVTVGGIKAGMAIWASIGIQPTDEMEEVTPALTRHTVGSVATLRAPDSRNISCHGEGLCLRGTALGIDLYRHPHPHATDVRRVLWRGSGSRRFPGAGERDSTTLSFFHGRGWNGWLGRQKHGETSERERVHKRRVPAAPPFLSQPTPFL